MKYVGVGLFILAALWAAQAHSVTTNRRALLDKPLYALLPTCDGSQPDVSTANIHIKVNYNSETGDISFPTLDETVGTAVIGQWSLDDAPCVHASCCTVFLNPTGSLPKPEPALIKGRLQRNTPNPINQVAFELQPSWNAICLRGCRRGEICTAQCTSETITAPPRPLAYDVPGGCTMFLQDTVNSVTLVYHGTVTGRIKASTDLSLSDATYWDNVGPDKWTCKFNGAVEDQCC